MNEMKIYGHELILDLSGCNEKKFTREDLGLFFVDLCKLIDMKPEDVHYWDDLNVPEEEKQIEAHTKGTSAVQFILTSSIVIHTLDELKAIFINIFSCKHFDISKASEFTANFFEAQYMEKMCKERRFKEGN